MKRKEKKAFVVAYSHGNFGDDLFVYLLCKRFPNVRFFMISSQKNECLNKLQNLKVLKENAIQKIMRKFWRGYIPFGSLISKCSITVLIGGSMFMQRDNWLQKLNRQKKIRQQSSRFCMLGCNFGPYKENDFLTEHAQFFSSFDDCCFRDERSYSLFRQNKNSRYAFDIAFSTPIDFQACKKKKKKVVVSLIDPSKRSNLQTYSELYWEFIKRVIQDSIKQNLEVTLLSLCSEQGDRNYCEKMRSSFSPAERISVLNYNGDIDAVLECFCSAEYVVATRFHAMILGFLCNCNVFPIIYNEKMSNVLMDLSFDSSAYLMQNMSSLTFESLQGKMLRIPDASSLVESSCKQFLFLDSFFGE